MKKVLMTGATGFVGGRLARRLLDDGHELRLLCRTPSDASDLADLGAEVVEGDVTDPDSVREAVRGVEGVFHLAAVYRLGGDLDRMRAVNVEGTRNVLDAARDEGIERVVHCGSDTSLGDTGGEVLDETATHDGAFRSVYARTKHEAHELVEARMAEGEPIVHAIVSSVYGPGDESPVAELIEEHLAGHLVAHLDRDAGYTFTHVDDVARGLQLAYEEGTDGEAYLIGGEPATFERFLEALSARSGVPAPRFELPSWLVSAASPLLRAAAPLLGKTSAEVRETLSMGRNVTRFFSAEKAERELGWSARSLEEGLEDTLPDFERREVDRVRDLLGRTGWILCALALFDLALGSTAAFFPAFLDGLMHAGPGAADPLLIRTGMIWLGFSLTQGIAGLWPLERRAWVLAAGVLRLVDVPADPAWLLTAPDLTWSGWLGLAGAPGFNLATGLLFVYVGVRGLRARRWEGRG